MNNNNENHIVISQSASDKWMKMDKSEIKKIFLKELNLIYPKANQKNLKKFSIVKQPSLDCRFSRSLDR